MQNAPDSTPSEIPRAIGNIRETPVGICATSGLIAAGDANAPLTPDAPAMNSVIAGPYR